MAARRLKHMESFTLKKYTFGDYLGIVGDQAHPVLAELRKRIDVDEDMPRLLQACAIRPGDVVVDVGSFVGDTAVPALKAGASVIGFEPFLDAFTASLYNTREFHPRFQGHNLPAGDGGSVKLIYECPGPNFGMRRVAKAAEGSPGSIHTYQLDKLVFQTEKVRLIKLDCEGWEIPTMLGARNLIERDRPFLYVEHFVGALDQAGYTADDLIDTLKNFGYSITMWGEPPRWDWFCVPR